MPDCSRILVCGGDQSFDLLGRDLILIGCEAIVRDPGFSHLFLLARRYKAA